MFYVKLLKFLDKEIDIHDGISGDERFHDGVLYAYQKVLDFIENELK